MTDTATITAPAPDAPLPSPVSAEAPKAPSPARSEDAAGEAAMRIIQQREKDGRYGQARPTPLPSPKERAAGVEAPLGANEKAPAAEAVEPKAEAKPAPRKTGDPLVDKATDAEHATRLVAARRALRRDGWDEADVNELKPEKLLAIGEKRLKNQTDVDKLLKRGQNANGVGDTTDPDGRDTAPLNRPRAAGNTPATEADDTVLSQIEELDPELAKAARKMLEGREQRSEKRLSGAVETLKEKALDAAWRNVNRDFADLDEKDVSRKVLKAMGRLDPEMKALESLDPGQIEDLIRDSYRLANFDRVSHEAKTAKDKNYAKLANGFPDTHEERPRRDKPGTQRDISVVQNLAMQAIEKFPGDRGRQNAWMSEQLG